MDSKSPALKVLFLLLAAAAILAAAVFFWKGGSREDEGGPSCSREIGRPEGVPPQAEGGVKGEIDSAPPLAKDSLSVPPQKGPVGLRSKRDKKNSITGRVRDALTGDPVPGALVVTDRFDYRKRFRCGGAAAPGSARTDGAGRFVLPVSGRKIETIAVLHPDYAVETLSLGPRDQRKELTLYLHRGPRVFGTARDDEGVPRPGIEIAPSGAGIPFPRTVVTDASGRYRTAPVRPGRVWVTASKGTEGSPTGFSFTEETREVVLTDRDMEVDFGPSREYATWRGVLYAGAGLPLAGGLLDAEEEAPSEGGFSRDHETVSDEQGRFELRKLLPGRYRVFVSFPGEGCRAEGGTVLIDHPGLVAEDVHIGGGEIRGIVVDEISGKPPLLGKGDKISLMAANRSFPEKIYTALAGGGDGRFVFRGLPAGRYDIFARIAGSAGAGAGEGRAEGIALGHGETLRDVKILMPSKGTLDLILSGFSGITEEDVALSLERENGWEKISGLSMKKTGTEGTFEARLPLGTGGWIASLVVRGRGHAEKRFAVATGGITRIVVGPADLSPAGNHRRILIEGSLCRRDGSPAAGVTLCFVPEPAGAGAAAKDLRGSFSLNTDSHGRFKARIEAGPWKVIALMEGDAEIVPADLHVDDRAAEPVAVELTLPGG